MSESAFTGRDSFERVQQLQALVAESRFEALLLVGGADGLFSRGSQAALKYLFVGTSGQELLGEQVIPPAFESLEDVVVLVAPTRVAIYYTLDGDSASFLLPLLGGWRNVTEFVATDEQHQDDRELVKIRAFRDMVNPFRSVGVPVGSSDPMAVERWPLVQAFGLDDVSQKGFFTMRHEAVDAEASLLRRMMIVDNYVARRLVFEAAPALALHFTSCLTKLDHATDPDERHAKSELDWGEDLISFYEFGTIRHEARGLVAGCGRGARVLFGTRTAQPATAAADVCPHEAGVGSLGASHLLLTAEEPLTGLRFARTYFLGTGRTAPRVVDPDALVHPSLEKLDRYDDVKDNAEDTRLLIDAYVALLQAHKVAIDSFVAEAARHPRTSFLPSDPIYMGTGDVNLEAVKAATLAALQPLLAPLLIMYTLPATFADAGLSIEVECLDACGEPITSVAASAKWSQWYLTLALSHVPSQSVPGETLGSIVVGDTLLMQTNVPTDHVVVTGGFDYFKTWVQAGKEADFASHLNDVLASEHMLDETLGLGREVGNVIPKASLLLQSGLYPTIKGTLRTFSHGLVFQSPQLNPIVVSFPRHVASLRVVPTPHEELLLLIVDFANRQENPVVASVPVALEASAVALPLVAGTRMQTDVLRILDTWKASLVRHDIPFHRPLRDAGDRDVPPGFAPGVARVLGEDGAAAAKARLLPHGFISKAIAQVSTWVAPRSSAQLCVPVTVLLGVPGSDVQLLSAALADISGATNAWHHVVVDGRLVDQTALESSVMSSLHVKVGAALSAIAAQASWELRPRVLVTVVGYVDCITVAAAFQAPPAYWVLPTKLSTLTACLSGAALVQPGSTHPLPKLWDQLTAGFATHVVVTSTAELSRTALHRVRTRIDAANPFADVFCLRSTVFEGDASALLVLDAFKSSEREAYRDRYFPGWATARAEASPLGHAVGFTLGAAIDRARFLACVQHGLTPHASLKSVTPGPSLKPASELKGLRLAQSLAMAKVAQTLKVQSPAIPPERVAALVTACGAVWSVEATVAFTEDDAHGYAYLNSGTKAMLKPVADSSGTCSFVFTGAELNADALRALLLECCPAKHEAVRPLQPSISLAVKRELQAQHKGDPLPDGFVYDGTYYYDYFGGQYEFHPSIDTFVAAHMAKLVGDAARQNEELAQDRLRFEECTKRIV
ncbi:hypothetical protein ACHHYP_04841 [Achlya hypogyna]|uniref:Uncharacterized protein n=1 Tax=Achlya hypogyna TaxID=1202772 RepID=A0A1V9YZS7_ACHHY|nr:hypothetical protein ACHHYP_04841 [Achlya hypogyna]